MTHVREQHTVFVDKRGRLVLSARIRERLGLKNGGNVSIRIENPSRIVIERETSDDVKKEKVSSWVRNTLDMKAEANTRRSAFSKWLSSDYARRKLGLKVIEIRMRG